MSSNILSGASAGASVIPPEIKDKVAAQVAEKLAEKEAEDARRNAKRNAAKATVPGEPKATITSSAVLADLPPTNDVDGQPEQATVPNEQTKFGTRQGDASGLLASIKQAHQQPPVQPSPAPAAPESGGVKPGTVDPESIGILRWISEDFVMLTGKEPYAYHIESGDLMGKESLVHFCNEHFGVVLVMGDNGEWEEKPSGLFWWGWNDRTGSRRRVRRVVMEPTNKPEHEGNRQVFNLWYTRKKAMCEPDMTATKESIIPLLEHLSYLADGDQVVVWYFLNWLATLYQRPDIKIPSAFLFYSRMTGVGKSMLHKLLAPVFGQCMVGNCKGKDLTKSFDDVTEHKRLLIVNEMARSEKADNYENFKSMISEDHASFEGKHRAAKDIRNITHFIVTTNHRDALPLAQGDRRIAVFRCDAERKHPDYYVKLLAWVEGPGPALLAGVLAQWKFDADWNPYAPVPQTEAAKELQNISQGPLFANLQEMYDARMPPFHRKAVTAKAVSQFLNPPGGQSRGAVWGCKTSSDAVGPALRKIGLVPWEGKVEFSYSKKGGARTVAYLLDDCEEWWQRLTPRERGVYLEGSGSMSLVQDQPGEVSNHDH